MKQYNKYNLGLISLFFTLIVIIFFFSLQEIKKNVATQTSDVLHTILQSTQEALNQWAETKIIDAEDLAKNELIIEHAENLLKCVPVKNSLLSHESTKELRSFLKPILHINGDKGFFIISKDYVSLASMRDNNTGTINKISFSHKDLLDLVFEGNNVVIPPMRSDVPLLDEHGNLIPNAPTMFFISPIYKGKKIIAAFSIRVDPIQDFNHIAKIGRIGKTGETYAFDKNAILLTESRFCKQLEDAGLKKITQSEITNIAIYDPGANLVKGEKVNQRNIYTKMAEDALKGNSGFNINGYRDYRGVEVLGAWTWDNKLALGLTTEIDKSEAFYAYEIVRKIFFIVVFITILLSVTFIISLTKAHKRTKQILIDSNIKLEQTVKTRTKELQESNATKDRFFSIIAHDLRSPISGILNLSDFLSQQDPKKSDAEQLHKTITLISKTTHQVYRLLDNLLNWSRSQTNSLKINITKVNLSDIIDDTISLQKQRADEKHILVNANISENIYVKSDRNLIQTVIRNLLSNAIKFTDIGGTITIDCIKKDDVYHVSIHDNGIGIDDTTISKLFKIEEHISTLGTNNESGTGLGLILCKEFIEKNNGTITVESEEGVGTTFTITVPVYTE